MSKHLTRKVLVPVVLIIVGLIVLNLLPIPNVIVPEISIPAEPVFDLFGFTITNTLLSSWLTMLVLILGSWVITRKMKRVPGRWQGVLEMVIETFYGLVEGASGSKWARRFFPIVMTIFLFLLVSNWLGLTPLFGGWGPLHHSDDGHPVKWLNDAETVGIWIQPEDGQAGSENGAHEGEVERYALAPMFRSAATDLNVTFALALISMTLVQYFGVKSLGIGYVGKFIAIGGVFRAFTKPGLGCGGRVAAFIMGLIDIFIGFVELISELGKVISFSFRLFGNIFAGEVLLGVIAFLIPYLISIPFYGLELLVGVVQAMVFMMLTVAFFVVAISGHGGEAH